MSMHVTVRQRAAALVAGFLHFDLSFMAWILFGALGVFLAASFHLSAAQKGLLVAVPTLSGALARVPVGMLANRYGSRAIGFLTLACSLLGLLLAGTVGTSYPRLLAIGVVLGVSGASFAVALPLASQWYPRGRQGIALGVVGAGNSGTVIATFLAPRVAQAFGWPAAFLWALVPIVAVTLVWFLLARDAPARPRRSPIPWRSPDLYALMAIYSLTFGGFVGLSSFLPIYLHDQLGLAAVAAGTAATGLVLAGSGARPLGGWLADTIGGRRLLIGLLLVVAAAAAAAPALAGGPAIAALAVLMAALGAGNGATFQIVPLRFGSEIGSVTGIVGAAGGLGGFLLPTVLGAMRDATGSYETGFAAFALAAAVVALAVVVAYGQRWQRTFLARSVREAA
jgi:MFS transporter, NNP family, nitrate/nitrite transporter